MTWDILIPDCLENSHYALMCHCSYAFIFDIDLNLACDGKFDLKYASRQRTKNPRKEADPTQKLIKKYRNRTKR